MGDSIAERMDAGWQAARHWETECEAARNQLAAVTAERDAYLETIHATFRVLESRGQAPDDNAPLSVTVRRLLDFLDTVIAERDALSAELAALKKRVADAVMVDTSPTFSADLVCYAVRAWVPSAGRYALVRLEDGE